MKKNIIYSVLSVLLLAACSEDRMDLINDQEKLPIHVSSHYPVEGVSRVTDNGFVADDVVGIFVVDYNKDGTPGTPAVKGNRASNVKFSFDGVTWKASYQLFWADGKTPADFYGYYPYDEGMTSVTDYPFAIQANQNSMESGYADSDLLWSKAEKVEPTVETIQLRYRHLMAGITVSLEKGNGFTANEWNELEKVVLIENTILDGVVNLATGTPMVGGGDAESIKPLPYNNGWRAVVYPQSVEAGKRLISITIDGQNYSLVKDAAMSYLSGKMHNFTITVDRKEASGELIFTLKADDIVAWIDDTDLHDGLVRQYLLLEIENPGTLEDKINFIVDDCKQIQTLQIKGTLNHQDLRYIGEQLTNLTALNLRDVVITGSEEEKDVFTLYRGFYFGDTSRSLSHLVLPSKLKAIADGALSGLGLTGTVTIPEGVEYIGVEAFCGNKLRGEIKLPSSLKVLRGGAFAFNSFTGELHLPDGLEIIGPQFYGAQNRPVFLGSNLTGPLNFPSNLKECDGLGFMGTSGKLVIPKALTVIHGEMFVRSGATNVEFHDGITRIEGGAFAESSLSGELVLPPNLTEIEGAAFAGTKISKIIFPDKLRLMQNGAYDDSGIFRDCIYLTGTVELPKNVARIPAGCFYDCYGITGLVIPKGVEVIDKKAFWGCSGINSIVCEGEEPPLICEEAFHGVNKDNFTVEVPKGCVEKYKQAKGWSEFKRIAEYSNFVCRPAQANALNTVHTETLVLNADGAWEVEHCPDWVTLSSTSGKGKTELRMTFKQMEHGAGNRRDSILFRMPAENHTTYCVVSQYDYEHEEDSYLTLQNHTQGEGIDIVFVGDGFNGQNISDGSYLELVQRQTEYFFGVEPYKSHRDYFNVYVTFPLSQETGVNTMYTYVNNRFGTLYGYDGGSTYNRLLTETDEVFNYAVDKTPLTKENRWRSMIILVPNSDAYDGVTEFKDGVPMSICPPSNRPYPQDARGVIQHEAGGHGFGRLADESVKYCAWPSDGFLKDIEEKQSWGWYQNVATTSKMKQVPWADFIFDTRYSDYVDVYEGACDYMRGVFRSEANSCMNYGIPYYNTISRLSIMRRIFDYARKEFTMDYFYEHDTNEWGDRDGATRSGTAHAYFTGSSYAGSNRHCEPQWVDAKKQGDYVRKLRQELKAKREMNK
jgi:hypothetical protein